MGMEGKGAVKEGSVAEFQKFGLIKDSLPYIGGGSFLGYLVFYFILYNQKAKNLELETVIREMRLAGK